MTITTIDLEGVSFRYGAVTALADVDLSLRGGEIVSLIGQNGSGKTTLLRLLAGLEQPSSGQLQRTNAAVAYVGQLQHHHPWMPLTVGEVITTARYRERGLWRRITTSDHDMCRSAAGRLGVDDIWSKRFTDLSGGQRQRTVIARALAADAQVVLLDEPITGLDLTSQRVITDVMQAERTAGRLVLFSTH
ncbi:MAG: metal ABC transporter ATP-binding protein, partial [Actinomycetota bacterium]|nr:metal ABC transporter ATP-binding protein [Actinomycetota bacterium]